MTQRNSVISFNLCPPVVVVVAPNRNHEIRFIIGTKGNCYVGCQENPGGDEHSDPAFNL